MLAEKTGLAQRFFGIFAARFGEVEPGVDKHLVLIVGQSDKIQKPHG